MQNHFLLLRLSLFNLRRLCLLICSPLQRAKARAGSSRYAQIYLLRHLPEAWSSLIILFETARFELYKINLYKAEIRPTAGLCRRKGRALSINVDKYAHSSHQNAIKRKKHHFLLDIENLSYTQCSKFLLPHRKRFPTIVDIINGDGYG